MYSGRSGFVSFSATAPGDVPSSLVAPVADWSVAEPPQAVSAVIATIVANIAVVIVFIFMVPSCAFVVPCGGVHTGKILGVFYG